MKKNITIAVLFFLCGALFAQDSQLAYKDDQDPPENIQVDKMPVPISSAAPAYPELLRKAGIEGMVWLKLIVDQNGNPMKVSVVRSESNAKDGNAFPFEQAAINAVYSWKFSPAVLNGKPVKVWVTVPFKFKLDQK